MKEVRNDWHKIGLITSNWFGKWTWAVWATSFLLREEQAWTTESSRNWACLPFLLSPYPRKHQIIRLLEKRNILLLNLLMSETIKLQFYPLKEGGGEGGYFTKFYTGRLCPKVQPLNLLSTTLTKTVLLPNTFYWQMVPLSQWYPLTSFEIANI